MIDLPFGALLSNFSNCCRFGLCFDLRIAGRSCGVAPPLGIHAQEVYLNIVGNRRRLSRQTLERRAQSVHQSIDQPILRDPRGTWALYHLHPLSPVHSASQLQNLPTSFGPSSAPQLENSLLHQPTSIQFSRSSLLSHILLSLPRPLPQPSHSLLSSSLSRPLSYHSSVPRFNTYIENTKCPHFLSFCQTTQITQIARSLIPD